MTSSSHSSLDRHVSKERREALEKLLRLVEGMTAGEARREAARLLSEEADPRKKKRKRITNSAEDRGWQHWMQEQRHNDVLEQLNELLEDN